MPDEETRNRIAIGLTFLGSVVFIVACGLGLAINWAWKVFS